MLKNKELIFGVSRELFETSLMTYLVLTVMETLKTGLVTNFFSLNWLLLLVFLSGMVMALTDPNPESENRP